MSAPLSTVVAIPVRDEAERIGPCLDALAAQRDGHGRALPMNGIGVVLMLNNCTDETPAVVRALQPSLPFPLTILERHMPAGRAHAGWARKLAMDAGADLLTAAGGPTPVLMMTDADGRVHPRWISANLAAIAEGADLVAGYVRADRAEHAMLPPSILHRSRLESRYEWLLAELDSRLDPVAHDPWPRHRMASGASLAVTLDAYRRCGGLPPIPTGEDRAMARSAALLGGRLRHTLAAQVVVSCRLDGRAVGGMAETIKQRVLTPEVACDPALEPVQNLVFRARWRAEMRQIYAGGPVNCCPLRAQPFAAAWSAIEASSPNLAYRALLPRELPDQIAAAQDLLAELRGGSLAIEAAQHVDTVAVGPLLQHERRERRRGLDEKARRRIAA